MSTEQKLLLQACVLNGKDAINAWETWTKSVDIDLLDSASNSLLCQLYCNLSAHKVEDFHMTRLKGIYKRHWYANQLLLNKLKNILQCLESYNIPTILFDEVAMVAGYYKDYGSRNIHRLSLLIHPLHGEKVISLLQELDWNLVTESQFILNERNLNVHLEDRSKTKLHLQGHIFWATPQEYTEQQVWNNAVPCEIDNLQTLILNPTDLFLYYCLVCFYQNKHKQINLLVDAITILKEQKDINWKQLVTLAQRYQITLALKEGIVLLQDLFQLSVPDWVILDLDRTIEKENKIREKINKTKYARLFIK